MSTYRSIEGSTGLTAGRELRAARSQCFGLEPKRPNDGPAWSQPVQETPTV